jgi:hypothetical protein
MELGAWRAAPDTFFFHAPMGHVAYFASVTTGEPMSTIAQPAMAASMRKAAVPSATMIRITHVLVV